MSCLPEEFYDRHRGQACIILGCGPSVGDFDLTDPFFAENVTFGCNKIGVNGFAPTYYMLSDWQTYDEWVKYVTPKSTLLRGEYVRGKTEPAVTFRYGLNDLMHGPVRGRLYHAKKSGELMMHVAYQMGFDMYFILGIDGYCHQGAKYFYPDTSKPVEPMDRGDWNHQAIFKMFAATLLVENKTIRNLSSRSVFKCFPYCTLDEAKEMVLSCTTPPG